MTKNKHCCDKHKCNTQPQCKPYWSPLHPNLKLALLPPPSHSHATGQKHPLHGDMEFITMNSENNSPSYLRIWQQNLNNSFVAQHTLLNSTHLSDFEILFLQELHINGFNNTISNHHYHVLYPSTHFIKLNPKSWAVTLISTSIDTNAWKQLPFLSPDVVIIQVTGNYWTCTLINIYNDCKHNHNETIKELGITPSGKRNKTTIP